MLLGDVFERFVMIARSRSWCGVCWRIACLRVSWMICLRTRRNSNERTLLFSSVVDLMGLVVNRIHPAINSASKARADTIAWHSAVGAPVR